LCGSQSWLQAGFQPARRPERPPAGKIACHTKRTCRRCQAHLNFLEIRRSEVIYDCAGRTPFAQHSSKIGAGSPPIADT
jgi:hypothetical protein